MKRFFNCTYLMLLLFITCLSTPIFGQEPQTKPTFNDPAFNDMTIEVKRSTRTVILQNLIVKYNQNKTFPQMYQYMELKYKELKKSGKPPEPDLLITETLDKSRSVFEKTKSYFGNKFKRQYDPDMIETNVNKYLWLKGVAFLILGIGPEHKIAISYFYQPGNERIKHEFMMDTVKYSYPEVLDIPENAPWFTKMSQVMDKIAFKVFNVKNYEE